METLLEHTRLFDFDETNLCFEK